MDNLSDLTNNRYKAKLKELEDFFLYRINELVDAIKNKPTIDKFSAFSTLEINKKYYNYVKERRLKR